MQAGQGTGPFFDCGPGGSRAGLCGGIGGVCCSAGLVCAANACVAPASTPTVTPTQTPPPTPTSTPPPNPCTGKPDGTTCDAGFDWGTTLLCEDGECQACAINDTATPRFVDSGDGTITDRQTCLVWEKKDDSGSIHDRDNVYEWSIPTAPTVCSVATCPPNGSAFTVFLSGLNFGRFAGHGDWRLPYSAGGYTFGPPPEFHPTGEPAQIESILDVSRCPTDGGPIANLCLPEIFETNCGDYATGNPGCTIDGAGGTEECSCTSPVGYISFSTLDYAVAGVWGMNYLNLTPIGLTKAYGQRVRAVRGSVVFVP